MFDHNPGVPELGSRVRVRFLDRYWVDGVIVAFEEADGVPNALVELDPEALMDWDIMVDLDGLKLGSPFRLLRRLDRILIMSAA